MTRSYLLLFFALLACSIPIVTAQKLAYILADEQKIYTYDIGLDSTELLYEKLVFEHLHYDRPAGEVYGYDQETRSIIAYTSTGAVARTIVLADSVSGVRDIRVVDTTLLYVIAQSPRQLPAVYELRAFEPARLRYESRDIGPDQFHLVDSVSYYRHRTTGFLHRLDYLGDTAVDTRLTRFDRKLTDVIRLVNSDTLLLASGVVRAQQQGGVYSYSGVAGDDIELWDARYPAEEFLRGDDNSLHFVVRTKDTITLIGFDPVRRVATQRLSLARWGARQVIPGPGSLLYGIGNDEEAVLEEYDSLRTVLGAIPRVISPLYRPVDMRYDAGRRILSWTNVSGSVSLRGSGSVTSYSLIDRELVKTVPERLGRNVFSGDLLQEQNQYLFSSITGEISTVNNETLEIRPFSSNLIGARTVSALAGGPTTDSIYLYDFSTQQIHAETRGQTERVTLGQGQFGYLEELFYFNNPEELVYLDLPRNEVGAIDLRTRERRELVQFGNPGGTNFSGLARASDPDSLYYVLRGQLQVVSRSTGERRTVKFGFLEEMQTVRTMVLLENTYPTSTYTPNQASPWANIVSPTGASRVSVAHRQPIAALQVISPHGQVISARVDSVGDDRTEVELQDAASGLYYLEIRFANGALTTLPVLVNR